MCEQIRRCRNGLRTGASADRSINRLRLGKTEAQFRRISVAHVRQLRATGSRSSQQRSIASGFESMMPFD